MTRNEIIAMARHLGDNDPLEEEGIGADDPRNFLPVAAPNSTSFLFLVAVGVTVSVVSHFIFAGLVRRTVRRALREGDIQ